MTDDHGAARVELRRLFPWTEIFRAFQIALDPSKLLLATGAVVALWLGWSFLGVVFGQNAHTSAWPANVNRGPNPFTVVTSLDKELFTKEYWFGGSGHAPPVQLEVFRNFLSPVIDIVHSTPKEAAWWYSVFGVIYTLAVWALFGGAITRIAAVQIARREKISMGEALNFSKDKFLSYFTAPLIPLGGIAGLLLLLIIGGLLIHIPVIGDLIVAVLFVKALVAGFIMALLIVGYIGWPLMYATVSTEGTDAFDALSRCYAYVYQRPWHYALYFLVALVYGVVVVFFVVFMASFAVYLVRWGLGMVPFLGWREYDAANMLRPGRDNAVDALFVYAPISYHWREMLTGRSGEELAAFTAGLTWYQAFAALIIGLWLNFMFLVVIGFGYSFFWSAGTVIYFLLRKLTDDTDLDEVYLEEEDEAMAFAPPGESATLPMPGTSPVPPPPPAGTPDAQPTSNGGANPST